MKLLSHTLINKVQLAGLQQLVKKQQSEIAGASKFVKAIEQGNLDTTLASEDGADQDVLASSLTSMRDQMKQFAKEEKQRNWVTQGLAQFVDILRSKNDNIAELTDNIIRSLIKYMNANQGALYILNDDNAKDVYLEMTACYAYNRKKHLNNRIELGQGITGQVVLEKSTLYMTDVPKDFMRITSGLGEALPRNIVIVPLKIDQAVFGVIEIASFDPIPPYQIEFVEKLGESIASTISSVKVSERTKQLLTEAQQQAEEMRAQEEEMRQNMEELAATQEDMQRVLREVQGKEQYMTDLIDASRDSILTVDRDLKVINCNTVFKKSYSGLGMEIDKGFDLTLLFATEEEKNKYRALYRRVFAGERFEVNDHYKFQNIEAFYLITYSPVTDENGEVIAAAVFVTDITSVTRAKNEAQQQAEEMKAQEEELRQNMEELSATQDEMHRVLKEVQEKEAYINEVLNASKDSIFTVDADYRLISWNSALAVGIEAMGISIVKGMDILAIYSFDPSKVEAQRSYYSRVLGGETFEISETFTINGVDQHYSSVYTPLARKTGEVFAAAIYARDMTLLTNALNESKRLAAEAQQQAEEVKAQEEELRQNMEELSATQDEMQRVLNEVQAKEQYMVDMINSTKDTIISVDRNYRVVNFNEAMSASYSGMGVKIEKGFDLTKIFSEQEWPKFKSHYDRAFKGESFELTEEYNSNGFNSYFAISYSPLRNEKNEVVATAVFAKDTTQTVKAQKEAENLQRYYNDVIEGMSDCVVTIDKNYIIVVANTAFKQVFSGYGLSVEPGSSLLAMTKGDKKAEEQSKKPYIKAFAGEHVEEPHRHHFDRDFQVSYNPLKDAKGEVIGVSLIAHDITQRLQLLKESQQQTEEVKAQEEELRQNMEEMQSIQEDAGRKAEEIERVRRTEKERADSQINAQKKIMETTVEKFRKTEAEYIARIQKLEAELAKNKKGAVA